MFSNSWNLAGFSELGETLRRRVRLLARLQKGNTENSLKNANFRSFLKQFIDNIRLCKLATI